MNAGSATGARFALCFGIAFRCAPFGEQNLCPQHLEAVLLPSLMQVMPPFSRPRALAAPPAFIHGSLSLLRPLR